MDDNGRNDCFMSNALCLSLPAAVWEYLSWLQFLVRRMEIQRNALKSKRRHTHDPYFASLPVFCGADLSVFKYFLSVINHHVWACKWLFVILYGKTWKSNKSCGHTCAEKKATLAWKLEGQKRHVIKLTRQSVRLMMICQLVSDISQLQGGMSTGYGCRIINGRDWKLLIYSNFSLSIVYLY